MTHQYKSPSRVRTRLEDKALDDLRAGIACCETVRDFISLDLLMHILENEEEGRRGVGRRPGGLPHTRRYFDRRRSWALKFWKQVASEVWLVVALAYALQ